MKTDNDIKSIYEKKLETVQLNILSLQNRSQRYSTIRLILFIGTVTLAAISLFKVHFSLLWAVIPLMAFIVSVVKHDRIFREKERLGWILGFYEDGLRRINDAWYGHGLRGTDYVDENHLFARDLDIFGEDSLFELMCTAQTAGGETQLAAWLTAPSERDIILARQEAVKELTDQLQLREDISVAARRMRSLLDPQRLNDWATASSSLSPQKFGAYRTLFFCLGAMAVAAGVSCFFTDIGLALLVGVGVLQWSIGRALKSRLSPILLGVEGPRRQLKIMSDILSRFEQQPVQCTLLQTLHEAFTVHRETASHATARLGRLVDWLDQAKNQVFAPIAFLLMWNGHFALSIEKWRLEFGTHIPQWLHTIGQMEALCALSGFAFEHPDYHFPEIVDGAPVYEGKALGHPLLPGNDCVRNSVSLSDKPKVWVVSGSNMSGKSTFLRVIGINAVLAMSGAPICGESLRMTPLAIGSTIRVLDSLHKGKSRFYTEISTLKHIMEKTEGTYPLLFLLDEIFHGTNSHDRTIGAQAVIHELIKRNAIGLVTTHDLALTKTADALGEEARNVHFDDTVKEGRLSFDYTLKDGPVTRSNALELMRSVGLKV